MSLRNIRKVFGGTQLPPPDEDSDNEFEPVYAKNHNKSTYAGLEISSDSEANESEEVVEEEPKPVIAKKRSQKKKRRQRKEKLHVVTKADDGLDEIDKCVLEINAVLGEPPKPPEVVPDKDPMKIRKRLFTVRQQNLAPEAELTRRFGPDEDDDKKKGRQPNLRIISQKGYIIETEKIYKRRGLTMSLLERKKDAIYYKFEHSKDYQSLHRTFLYTQDDDIFDSPPYVLFPLEESQHRLHVEGLLETADREYFMEEYSAGNKVIEEVISYMQHCAHPFFSVTDIRARLEYKYVENRAFHIALMKYMHMLTNKACHRTALEVAKILLNLDPSDPLAVLFIIDTIAIRAGEHQWVIDAIDFWKEERDAGFLFNMQYSYALATFHVALKSKQELPMYKRKAKLVSKMTSALNLVAIYYKLRKPPKGERKRRLRPEDDKVGFEEADELLQKAMIKFPSVVSYMLQNAGVQNEKIQSCPLFDINANDGTSSNLKALIMLYARFIWHKFIQDAVMKWLLRNASELVDKYENDPTVRAEAKLYANVRMNLFQSYPQEIQRHLSILTPLNNLIVDGAVPEVETVVSYDPFPPLDSVNLYEQRETSVARNIFYEVISNLLPEQDLMDGRPDREADLPQVVNYDAPFEAMARHEDGDDDICDDDVWDELDMTL
ncbi:ribosome quality control complex subunit TCF25-like [Epargyreus clarus]|uniref:ribosome quality control complex subunit TCF25-like n=1 Tax=Epargyreus clarus TaxID=520877 RepID=UPI003C2BA7D0